MDITGDVRDDMRVVSPRSQIWQRVCHRMVTPAVIEYRTIVLKDFVVEFTGGHETTLRMSIFGSGNDEDTEMEQTSPIMWKWPHIIELQPSMGELTFVLRSESTGDLGYLVLTEDQLAAFMTVDQDTKAETGFTVEDVKTSSKMKYTIGVGKRVDSVMNALQDPRLFPAILEQFTDDPEALNDLGHCASERFRQTGNEDDIKKSIQIHELTVQLTSTDDVKYPRFLYNTAWAMFLLCQKTWNCSDSRRLIAMMETAIASTSPDDPILSIMLDNLGAAFANQFRHTGDPQNIESSVSCHQRAVQLGNHTNMFAALSNLASAYSARFEHSGNFEDLQCAISYREEVMQLTPNGHPLLSMNLLNLGSSFLKRFNVTGDLADSERAISSYEKTGQLLTEQHPYMADQLSHLGVAFEGLFRQTGNLADVENAILYLERAIQVAPDGHKDLPRWLNNLGHAFFSRFSNTKDLGDIQSCISALECAVELVPASESGNPDRHYYLWNLGRAFLRFFSHTGNPSYLDKSLHYQQKTVDLTPEQHADISCRIHGLATCFRTRFNHSQDSADLETAIHHYQRALELTPERKWCRPFLLSELGGAFLARFNSTDDSADLDAAISYHQKALDCTPEDHSGKPGVLNNLAHSLLQRLMCTGNKDDLEQAIRLYSLSAQQITGDTSARLQSAWMLANICREDSRLSQSLDAFRVAMGLVSRVAGLEYTIHKRHENLVKIPALTSSAVATAIHCGDAESALAWLEQGRCLVWTQINQLRTPIDALRAHDPSLGEKFLKVSRALDSSASRQEQFNCTVFNEGNLSAMVSQQEKSHAHVHLAKQWDDLLSEIREIPGFGDFLQPPNAEALLGRLSLDGPLVIFNLNEARCDALALISGADIPLLIPLERFSLQKAVELRNSLRLYLSAHGVRMREDDRGGHVVPVLPKNPAIFAVLRVLWEDVVKPILEAIGYSDPDHPRSRIWWCPTGPLSFLPIHAAGIYNQEVEHPGSCVSDFVISSYTPTVTALLDKRIRASTNISDHRESSRILLISQPKTPGKSPIPATVEETRRVDEMMSTRGVRSLLLDDTDATSERVKEEMKTSDWVHFACHAIQDAQEPLNSGVHLHDRRLTLLEIMGQHISSTEHAFMSACQTSTGDEKLPEEAVHLAAGMLAAGYRGVVATMWSIKDKYGPEIAEAFYAHLLEGDSEGGERRLDGFGAAHALDHATRKIRERIGDTEKALLTWVPYVHFGV
ncbi:unnamed protein product [Cyclocybe aegerita]|uniref:CHAT domain-containing protein n=1 Tax=Cyclocybe aegerita TaxID=1973307 RepID=A0A8S0XGV6_CYCAE|nr:unnamed protein product [Cyclocybe aegerita]